MGQAEAELLVGIGSQGTAALAIIQKLFQALISKGVLRRIEIIAILDAAAEDAERQPDKLGGMYSRSTGLAIRELCGSFLDAPQSDQKH